jgi:hypothetical protein
MANPIKVTINIGAYENEMINLLSVEEPLVTKHLISRMALRVGLEYLTGSRGLLREVLIVAKKGSKL